VEPDSQPNGGEGGGQYVRRCGLAMVVAPCFENAFSLFGALYQYSTLDLHEQEQFYLGISSI
jgi:hypothetical protein